MRDEHIKYAVALGLVLVSMIVFSWMALANRIDERRRERRKHNAKDDLELDTLRGLIESFRSENAALRAELADRSRSEKPDL